MYAQLALPSAGRAALRQRKGLESPHSLRWYVRRELWLAGSLQGCVKSWTPARASLPSHPLCQRVGKPRRTARGCAVPHGGTDRQTDRQQRPPPLLTSAKKAVVVILWLSNTLLSVGTRFLTIRGSLGPAWRAMALRAEGAASPTPGRARPAQTVQNSAARGRKLSTGNKPAPR